MNYVGIDPSLTSPGLAILDTDGEVRGLSNLVTRDLRGGARLEAIYDWAFSYLKDLPAYAVIEGYAINAQNRPYDLGEAGGVLRLALTHCQIAYEVVPPALVKKFVTGNGQATKSQVQEYTKLKWGFSIVQEDQADAHAMARLARAIRTGIFLDTAERAVVQKVTGVKLPKARPPRLSRSLNV